MSGGIIGRRYDLMAEILVWWGISFLALALVFRIPRRVAVVTVLLIGVVLRVGSLSDRAPLSDDLYRYAWDGVVQHAGINPYSYPPNSPELERLRDTQDSDWLWPQAWEGENRESRINREGVRTIYPPAAQVWFFGVHAIVPLSAEDKGYELTGLGIDLAILAVLLALLHSRGRDPRWIALYALSPMPALEAVQNAHIDALAILAVLGAVWLWPRRPMWASAALCTAALVKLYPGALLPLMLRARDSRVRVLAVFVGLFSLAYLPHLISIGTKFFGYLPGYLEEEQYSAGGRYLVLGLTGIRGDAASVLAVLALGALLVCVLRADLPLERGAVVLLAGAFLIATPVQPWYALLLVALVTLTGQIWALPIAIAPYPLFFATILGTHGPTTGRVTYGIAALCAATAYAHHRHRRREQERQDVAAEPIAE